MKDNLACLLLVKIYILVLLPTDSFVAIDTQSDSWSDCSLISSSHDGCVPLFGT